MGLSGISPAAQAVHADVAQLVEHHLAKVRVAGSSPVIRSQSGIHTIPLGVVGWPRGEAAACKAVYTGSNPVPTSGDWRRGSALPSHGRGHWFDPSIAHHVSRIVRSGFLYFPSCCVMVWGYRLPELSRAPQTLELQQCCFKDLSGGLDQHMRSLTHLLAAGWPRQVPPGGFSRAWGDEYHSWLCGCSDCPTWVHVASLEGEWLTGCPAAKWVNVVCGAPVWDVSFDVLVRAFI